MILVKAETAKARRGAKIIAKEETEQLINPSRIPSRLRDFAVS